jgi:hypothetical protein
MTRAFRQVAVIVFAAALSTPLSALGQTQIKARAATITVGGRLQVQAVTSSATDATSFDSYIRRARVFFGVEISDFFEARLLPDFAGGKVALQDAYISLNFDPALEASVGQFKRASEVFELSSSTQLPIIERDGRVPGAGDCTGTGGVCTFSRLMQKLRYSERDMGLRIAGSTGRFSYMATMTNGTGVNVKDENDGKSYSGRAAVEVADGFEIGGFVGLHDYPDAGGNADYGATFGADLDWGEWYEGLHLQAAMIGGDNWKALDASGNEAQFLTGQAVLTYFIPVDSDRWEAVEPLARVSWGDPDTETADDAAWLVTPGFSLFVSGRNKIATNLDIYIPEMGDSETSLKVQAFLYF